MSQYNSNNSHWMRNSASINSGNLVGGSLSASGLGGPSGISPAGALAVPPGSLGGLAQSSLQGPHVSTAPTVYGHLAAQPPSLQQYSAQQLQPTPLAMPTSLASQSGPSSISYSVPTPGGRTQGPGATAALSGGGGLSGGAGQAPPQQKQRVFTGVVTKLSGDFGFVDEDVFFQLNVCKGSVPKVGDRVLVEAHYNTNMPFKWNASRIQVLPNQASLQQPQPLVGPSSVGPSQGNPQQGPPPLMGTATSRQQHAVALGAQVQAAQLQAALQQQQQHALQQQVVSNMANQVNMANRFNAPVKPSLGLMNQSARSMGIPELIPGRSRFDRDRDRPSDRDKDRSVGGGDRDRRDRGDRDRGDRDRGDRDHSNRDRRSPPRKHSRSPVIKKSRSPARARSPRRRSKPAPRYMVEVPKVNLSGGLCSVMDLKQRYKNLYIPSDFSTVKLRWSDTFSVAQPFKFPPMSARFHVFSKEVDNLTEVTSVIDPPDADPTYSAKVMLLSSPVLEELYKRTCGLAEDVGDGKDDFHHPSRDIQFLVGMRGRGEPMAIGGPWSPSLDGENPKEDPQVLINTAVRTTHALTGIDLGMCTQWYRFTELSYQRAEETRRGRHIPAHTQTVVVFLPDVWNCLPSRVEWQGQLKRYQERLLEALGEAPPPSPGPPAPSTAEQDPGEGLPGAASNQEDEVSEQPEKEAGDQSHEPTHHDNLDPKAMKVQELRDELDARQLNSKGLKSQLVARLTKALRAEKEEEENERDRLEEEAEKEEKSGNDQEKKDLDKADSSSTQEVPPVDKAAMEKLYSMPSDPAIVIHPSRTAKGGKFDVSLMSLSVLLDYRQEDNKEHSFEVSLFAEAFNEMLMRDFGFVIYKRLLALPPKKKEEKKEDKTSSAEDSKGTPNDDKKVKVDKKSTEGREEGSSTDRHDEEPPRKKKRDTDDQSRDEGSSRSSNRDKDSSKKKKLVTLDKEGLLAFIYYDSSHTGYILERDIEGILLTLGLGITRSQIKKLLAKASQKDEVHYRRWTDAEEDESLPLVPIPSDDEIVKARRNGGSCTDGESAAAAPSGDSALVTHRGVLVNMDSIMAKLEENTKIRSIAEGNMKVMETTLSGLRSEHDAVQKTLSQTSADLKDQTKKLSEQVKATEEAKEKYATYEKLLVRAKNQLGSLCSDIMEASGTKETAVAKETSSSKDVKRESNSVKKESSDGSKVKQEFSSDRLKRE